MQCDSQLSQAKLKLILYGVIESFNRRIRRQNALSKIAVFISGNTSGVGGRNCKALQ